MSVFIVYLLCLKALFNKDIVSISFCVIFFCTSAHLRCLLVIMCDEGM